MEAKSSCSVFSPSQCKRGILCSELVLCCPLVWLFLGVMSRAGRRGKHTTSHQSHHNSKQSSWRKAWEKYPDFPFNREQFLETRKSVLDPGWGCIAKTAGWLGLEDVKWDRALAIHLAVCIWRADAGRDDKTRWGFFLTFSPLFCLQRVNQTWTWNHIKLSSYCIGSLTGHVLKGLWVFGFVDFIWLPRTRWKLYSSACSDL